MGLGAIHRTDLRLFRRVALGHSPPAQIVLPRLTRAADHSMLWFGVAGVLWLSRSRGARRAALRGLGSLAASSLLVNGPVKWAARRKRPALDDVPEIRRLRRLPTSSSFPSGHSASAFAFAAAVTMEKPVLGLAILPAAAAVGASRVYVGVHYPSDVLVGATLGSLLALASKAVWPLVPEQPPRLKRRPGSRLVDRPADGEGLTIVVNAGAGSSDAPTEVLRQAFPDAEVVEVGSDDGDELRRVLEDAAKGSKMIAISGGDGSINCAAQVAVDSGTPLAVLPSGTLNHLARDLAIDDLEEGIEAIRTGSCVSMDVATIDGQVFLNTASFGSYVDLVDARERLERKIGKWPAVLIALAKVLRASAPIEVEIDGTRRKVWMAFIGNCRYHPSGFAPTWRADLADGQLDVRLVDGSRPLGRVRLMASISTGRLARSSVYTQWTARSVKVRTLDGRPRLARDGETFEASSDEFFIEKHPERLAVLVPSEDQERFR